MNEKGTLVLLKAEEIEDGRKRFRVLWRDRSDGDRLCKRDFWFVPPALDGVGGHSRRKNFAILSMATGRYAQGDETAGVVSFPTHVYSDDKNSKYKCKKVVEYTTYKLARHYAETLLKKGETTLVDQEERLEESSGGRFLLEKAGWEKPAVLKTLETRF